MTFAAFDWVMSLEPHWFSTIFGMLFIAGQGLGALAIVVVVAFLLSRREEFGRVLAPTILNDLGNLLLAFVMIWAYLVLLAVADHLGRATCRRRFPGTCTGSRAGGRSSAALLAVFYFAVPFLILLGRGNKRQLPRLAAVAAAVLVVRLLDVFFLIAPAHLRETGCRRTGWMSPRWPPSAASG